MADRYDLRSQQEVDRTSYVSLPGTSNVGEFVNHNMTPMKSKLSPAREVPGCNPGRWIYELVNNCFTVCDIFDRARHAKLETPFPWQHTHQLVINGNQTHTPIISAVCLDCHFHFVFKTAWKASCAEELCHHQKARWPLQDPHFPWHHLVWAGSEADSTIRDESSKYYPLLAREFFVCSAPPCTFEITLEVSAPRMPSSWISLLEDHGTIRENLRTAKEQEPARYESAPEHWIYQAPSNLNTYLKNLIEAQSPEDARNISKRNKRFAVLFGPRCYRIFRELGFEEQVAERDGIDEGVFVPKLPPPPSGPALTSALGTYRAYLEDVRSEVQCLIHKKSQSEEKPTFCLPLLAAELHCEATPKLDTNPFAKLDRYKLLGVLPDQRKEMMVNAYKRQWELLPSKRKELIEALMAIANDNNDQELSEYAMTQSSVFESQIQQQSSNDDDDGLVSQALNFLGLRPPNNYSAESLIQAYRQKLAKDPGDANTARSMLSLIAQASTDDTYQATLLMETDAKMSFNTAKAILGLTDAFGFGPDTLDNTKAKITASKLKEEKATYLDAMEAIADHVNANDLKSTVAGMREYHGIVTPGGNTSVANQNRPVNYDLPVGLENIGNTCYLNSLLQYLYTVKPVRDVVLNYETFKLDLTDENIKERRLGSNRVHMERGEAVVAQAFAQELSKLFRALETSDKIATRPSQRLANAALLSTRTLLSGDSQQKPETSNMPNPPPLPARPSPAPPTNSSEEVDMISVTVNPVSELCETASTRSSQTLVDQNDDNDSEQSYEKVENLPLEPDTQESDVTMGDHDDTPSEEAQQITHETTPETSNTKLDDDKDSEETSIDVKMPDAEQSKTIDEKVLTALEHQKRSSGTDQEDVEEVLGSILNLLQAAIKPSSIDKSTGIQFEKIMETFFVTTVNYTKKFDGKTYNAEIVSDRSITAFPAPEGEGACSLHDALGRDFDQHTIDEDKLSRYTAIRTLPPVLHVLIQRSQALTSKNKNPIVIPELLYLDRYMDHPHDSPEFQKRVESWAISDRITDLRKHQAALADQALSATYLEKCAEEISGTADPYSDFTSQFIPPDETWDFDGPVEEDFLLINPPRSEAGPTPELPPKPEGLENQEETIRGMISKELRHREMSLQKLYEGESIPYRLHAVLCHRGQVMSGHYWVWIHDAEENVWRKYNDSNVEENRDTAEVLRALSTDGEPYFLCYVRDEDKDDFVDVPKRQRPQATEVDADGDVSVPTQGSETAEEPAGELPAHCEAPGA